MTNDNVTHLPLKWADAAMFEAESTDDLYDPGMGVVPKVHLLSMSHDPLGVMAACTKMYVGEVVRDLGEVTDDERRQALDDMTKAHLQMPLEAVKLHFMIDGMDRSFEQQLTRQRTAAYAIESLRFAVLTDLARHTSLPPSLYGTERKSFDERDPESMPDSKQEQRWRDRWEDCIQAIDETYSYLVADGMPAEDARGLLPLATASRGNYITDLKNLSYHAGNRLCTQAQLPWRHVFNQVVIAIRDYGKDLTYQTTVPALDGGGLPSATKTQVVYRSAAWQFEELSKSALFRPACYQLGRCPFKASFDRPCSIRSRVDQFASYGIPSDQWDHGVGDPDVGPTIDAIMNTEWLLDPTAARRAPQQGGQ